MINIAIVEDEEVASKKLESYFERMYAENREEEFSVKIYQNAVNFLHNFKLQFDIVLMDIEMPYMNGMDAAAKLRELDSMVTLIFVTNMMQYAVKGYEVKALDFIVKPVHYDTFAMKIMRAVRDVHSRKDEYFTIRAKNGAVRILVSDIAYVEVARHNLMFHTNTNIIEARGRMTDVESKLSKYHFLRCNICYLVNPKHIKRITTGCVYILNTELQISRPKKKSFLESLVKYFENN